MNCAWGYIWYGRYFYHGGLLLLSLFVGITIALFFFLLRKKRQKTCPGCNSSIEEAYLRCPECGQRLKNHCPGCYKIIEYSWRICPHCSTSLHANDSGKCSKLIQTDV